MAAITTTPELVVETGSVAGTRFLLDRPLITIGREEGNDIRLEDEMISKTHCRIITQGDNYLIEDLGSSNGTIVNGNTVNSHMLSDGDKLFLGETTLTFKKGAAGSESTPEKKAKSSRRGIWIGVGILAALVVIAGVTVVLVFWINKMQDKEPPLATIKAPTANQSFDLNLPVPAGKELTVTAEASDDKGLDKVEFLVNNELKETVKASKARKESKTGGSPKTEEFTIAWKAPTIGDYNLVVKAYDWAGKQGESQTIPINVQNGPDVNSCHAYCQKIDEYVQEFVIYRQKFNKAWTGAQNGTISYYEAAYVFNEVGDQRRSLRSRLGGTPPPGQFAASHGSFDTMLKWAIEADDYAVLWARDMELYEVGFYPVPDPNGYKNKVESCSASAQSAGRSFKQSNDTQRSEQLGVGPGPDPNA